MNTVRQNKVARLVQKALSEIFLIQSPILFNNAMVSVTVVRMSPDFSLAKAYLSIYTKEDVTEIFGIIQDNKKQLRNQLGQRIKNQVKIIPEIAFFIDDSLDYYNRIDELLKK